MHRIYPVADTTADPRLTELLKLVEELRADLLRRGLYRTNAAVCAMHARIGPHEAVLPSFRTPVAMLGSACRARGPQQ